jgi:hypothetical protein
MYENQENQEPKPELTTDEKIAQAGLTELATTPVKPLLDVLELEVTGIGSWGQDPTAEQVTIQQELVKLNKSLKAVGESKKYYEERADKFSGMRAELEDYLDENWSDIDEEVRSELCRIFGIDEQVEKSVEITIKGSITITAPRGYDWDNIENDLDIDGSVSITNSDLDEYGYGFSVDDVDVEVD